MDNQELSMFVLKSVTRKLHEGEYDCALQLGLGWDEIRALESLSLIDFQWMHALSPNFIHLEVRIDHEQFELAMRRLADHRRSREIAHRLLVNGAPRHLMSRLYGWIPQQYRSQRKILRLDDEFPNGGRPANPTLNEEDRILTHWDRLAGLDLPERYLETAIAAEVSVRQVCRALSLRDEREREAMESMPLCGRAMQSVSSETNALVNRHPLTRALVSDANRGG